MRRSPLASKPQNARRPQVDYEARLTRVRGELEQWNLSQPGLQRYTSHRKPRTNSRWPWPTRVISIAALAARV